MSVIEIKPSRLRAILVMVVHVGAAFSLVFLGDPVVATVLLAAIGLSARFGWRAWRRSDVALLGLEDDGRMVFSPAGAEEIVRPAPATVIAPGVVWLAWKAGDRRAAGAMMILRDQLSPGAWRALQIWLRLRARAEDADAGPPESV
ncbi:protein YgfX [Zoogloea sp.]|uniref:protein YgfX n=1 Tax=Zoogloea sp. TaxID=49181 RepID=UPI0035AEC308